MAIRPKLERCQLHSHGVDLLVAVELRHWFLKEIKADVATFNMFRSESMLALSALAARRNEIVTV